jgi:hypothetical protein
LDAGDYALLALSDNPALNGDLPAPDALYSGISFDLPADDVSVRNGAVVIDEVAWDAAWLILEGSSYSLLPSFLDAVSNDLAANWCRPGTRWSISYPNYGTPGGPHVDCE